MVDLVDSDFVFHGLPHSENGRFGKLGKRAEPSAPKGSRSGTLQADSRFRLRNSENEVNFAQCCQGNQ